MARSCSVEGMHVNLSSLPPKCEHCILGKQTRSSVPKVREGARADRVLGRVYVDLCGPMSIPSRFGHLYSMNIIDDFSDFVWSIPLRFKDQAVPALKAWLFALEVQSPHRLTSFVTDNGELASSQIQQWCTQKGILHLFTAPYTSAQNGCAKRLHHTLMDKAHAMMSACHSPHNMWDEFCATAVYLTNFTSASANDGKTPYELWYGRQPSLSHLREIGCRAFALIPTNNPKISHRSVPCILIRYAPQSKAYRLWDQSSNRVFNSFHVSFIELYEFPRTSSSTISNPSFNSAPLPPSHTPNFVVPHSSTSPHLTLPPTLSNSSLSPIPPTTTQPCQNTSTTILPPRPPTPIIVSIPSHPAPSPHSSVPPENNNVLQESNRNTVNNTVTPQESNRNTVISQISNRNTIIPQTSNRNTRPTLLITPSSETSHDAFSPLASSPLTIQRDHLTVVPQQRNRNTVTLQESNRNTVTPQANNDTVTPQESNCNTVTPQENNNTVTPQESNHNTVTPQDDTVPPHNNIPSNSSTIHTPVSVSPNTSPPSVDPPLIVAPPLCRSPRLAAIHTSNSPNSPARTLFTNDINDHAHAFLSEYAPVRDTHHLIPLSLDFPSGSYSVDEALSAISTGDTKTMLDGDDDPLWASAMSSPNREYWIAGARDELKSLEDLNVFILVPHSDVPRGQRPLKGKLVCKRKCDDAGSITRYKVRYVEKGIAQRYLIDYDKTTAPTARLESFRTLLHIAAVLDWDVQHVDIKTAFLHGVLLDSETVYMEQPPGFKTPGKEDWVMRLMKGLYGMKQASRIWNQTFHKVMVQMNFTRLTCEWCVYRRQTATGITIFAIHVDNIIAVSSSPKENARFKDELRLHWEISDLGTVKFALGIGITHDRPKRTVSLSQQRSLTESSTSLVKLMLIPLTPQWSLVYKSHALISQCLSPLMSPLGSSEPLIVL
jgi:transposase InsO family protein